MKTQIIFLMLFFLSLISCSQKLDRSELISRQSAERIIENTDLAQKVRGSSYVLFSISDIFYIVIVEGEKTYEEYYINSEKGNKLVKKATYKKSDELLKKMFNSDNYKNEFISFDSEFFGSGYELSSGNLTYFVLKNEEGERYGEARLSILIEPNPIDDEVYNYLTQKLLLYISK
ncbi:MULTISPECIES: hypothetical protein [Leeuwenhoekiella]|uniref:hypothetical protein n=1 Tax=Leeuwenhoekiella TaxID=283735 RepID=UPI0023526146|nr:hypothetical protein [Leeuwenhoekiella blandensis]